MKGEKNNIKLLNIKLLNKIGVAQNATRRVS